MIRNRLPKYSRPDVDSILNISPAIIVNQQKLGGNSRSTLGTITDVNPVRLLFSRFGIPENGNSYNFSFNLPSGMCPECEGLGRTRQPIIEKFFDKSKSLNEGAILFPIFSLNSWYYKTFTLSGLFNNEKN